MSVVQTTDHSELREALGLLIVQPEPSPADLDHQVDLLTRYAEKRGLTLDHCLVTKDQGRIIAACLCVDSPGRTSSVFIPATIATDTVARAVRELLNEASRRAQERGIQLLQGLVRPEAEQAAEVYRQADFRLLAQLIYLENDLTQPVSSGKSTPPVTWETYSAETHSLFAGVIERTYQGSLDCGSLNGLRDIEDILASHRAAGQFDPRFWLVGLVDLQPVGTILLSAVSERFSYEVVYMGVLPEYRGRGYGAVLLRRGIQMARDQAATTLSLAVDAQNTPARNLYRRFGFREASRRDAWIKILPGP